LESECWFYIKGRGLKHRGHRTETFSPHGLAGMKGIGGDNFLLLQAEKVW